MESEANIEFTDDETKPLHAAIRCPYCGIQSVTTLPPRYQVHFAEFRITHECNSRWIWEVTTS